MNLIKNLFFIFFGFVGVASYAQFRVELTGGPLFSTINLENAEVESGVGYQINAAYEYLTDERARTSFVFSLEMLQRKSNVVAVGDVLINEPFEAMQVGFSPKFRMYFSKEVRPYFTIGPSFRVNTTIKNGGVKLDKEAISKNIILGGVLGAGVVVNIGERFFVMAEAGAMNDFIDNLKESDSKFFDIYVRVGIRVRPN